MAGRLAQDVRVALIYHFQESMRKNRILIVAIFLTLYSTGYFIARYSHIIVHRSGYSTSQQGMILTASHEVAAGDFGVPMLNLGFSYFQIIISYIYFPVRYVEKLYWYIANPVGSEWLYVGSL